MQLHDLSISISPRRSQLPPSGKKSENILENRYNGLNSYFKYPACMNLERSILTELQHQNVQYLPLNCFLCLILLLFHNTQHIDGKTNIHRFVVTFSYTRRRKETNWRRQLLD